MKNYHIIDKLLVLQGTSMIYSENDKKKGRSDFTSNRPENAKYHN